MQKLTGWQQFNNQKFIVFIAVCWPEDPLSPALLLLQPSFLQWSIFIYSCYNLPFKFSTLALTSKWTLLRRMSATLEGKAVNICLEHLLVLLCIRHYSFKGQLVLHCKYSKGRIPSKVQNARNSSSFFTFYNELPSLICQPKPIIDKNCAVMTMIKKAQNLLSSEAVERK